MVVEPRHPLSHGMDGFTPAFVWKEGSCDLFGSSCSSGGLYPIHPVSYPMFDGHTPDVVWTNGMCLIFGEGCTGGGALHILPWTDAFEWWPLEEWISDTWSWTDNFWCDGSCGFLDVIVFPFKLIAFVLFAVVCGVGTVFEVIFCVLAKAVLLIAGVLGFLACIILVAICVVVWVVVMVADVLFMVIAALVFALELIVWAVVGLLGLIIWMLVMFASLVWWVIIAITWAVELVVSLIIWVLGVILWPVELVVMTMVAEFAYMCAWVNSMIVTFAAQPTECCTDRESSVYWISSLVVGLCACIGGVVLRGKGKADMIFVGAAAPVSMYCFSFWLSCVVQDRPQEAAFSVVICVSGIAGVLGFGYGRAKVAVQWWDQSACVVAWVMSVLLLIIGSVQISTVYTYDASWFADRSTNCSASDHTWYAGWCAFPVVATCIVGLSSVLWRAWSSRPSTAPPALAAGLLGVAGAVPTACVSRPASPSRSPAGGGDARAMAEHLFTTTWAKTSIYTFASILHVEEIHNPFLQKKYEAYKAQLPDDDINQAGGMRSTVTDMRSVLNQHGVSLIGNEVLVFHGCSEAACHSISQQGFLRKYWKTATGSWQRFGPGFYFALDASKSHEYPLSEMQAKRKGTHTRKMLLCKVARGRVLKTHTNMDGLQGAAPAGYDSIHGYASQGNLNYDEFVVFHEEAILPYAIVTYRYNRL